MKRAFTVLEVLASVAIIVVVIAIAFPVFGRAKNQAGRVVCISNLNQLATAMRLYREDYGDYPPNDPEAETFRTYYPTLLRCPASRYAGKPYLRKFDYAMVGTMIRVISGRSTPETSQKEFVRCREVRASSMPIAYDSSHARSLRDPRDTESFFLIARDGGSIERVIMQRAMAAKQCDPEQIAREYNF